MNLGWKNPQRVVELSRKMVSTIRTCLPSSTKPEIHKGEGVLERQEKERNFAEGKYVRSVMSVSRPEADKEKTACMDRVTL